MRRQPARALLIDLDGVLRQWDPQVGESIETKYGLAPGTLLKTAMTWDIYRPAVAGEIDDADWMRLIAMRLPLPEADAAAAVAEWQRHRGRIDRGDEAQAGPWGPGHRRVSGRQDLPHRNRQRALSHRGRLHPFERAGLCHRAYNQDHASRPDH